MGSNKWYAMGITAFCLLCIALGYRDLQRYPDVTQGLGLFNYWMCLVGTLMGVWISLWALIHVLKEKKIRDTWKDCAKNRTKTKLR